MYISEVFEVLFCISDHQHLINKEDTTEFWHLATLKLKLDMYMGELLVAKHETHYLAMNRMRSALCNYLECIM